MKWDFVYLEEHFDVNGYCSAVIISDGKRFLFFTIGCDFPGAVETCRIYSSITFCEESLECHYDWLADNDEKLLCYLNSLGEEEPYYGESSSLRKIVYISAKE